MQFSGLKPSTSNPQPQTSSLKSPTISIIIPTLNSASTLGDCLDSIARQNYPKDKLEIIIADGGSTDQTLEIISEFSAISNLHPQTSNCSFYTSNLKPQTLNIQIVPNLLKTGEAGKAVGVKAANNEVIALIDSDNILPEKSWLKRMIEPFKNPEIIGSEPLYYTHREEDGYITRYCALLGMNDPLCLFLGNYDRYSVLTGKWTAMPHKEVDEGDYLKVELDKEHLPTIGANGFFIRHSTLKRCDIGDYLFDIDVICQLLNPTNHLQLAKVKTGIVHIFSGDMTTFARKQRRRIKDYLFYSKLGIRKYPWRSTSRMKLLKFILFCLTILPLLIQSIKGYVKKSDNAWFFHPIACWLTLWEYGRGRIVGIFSLKELGREGWEQ